MQWKHCKNVVIIGLAAVDTRKLSYRKDDRAMRPIFGYPENFERPCVQPRLLFPKFLMDFVPIEPINVHSKFEVPSFTRSWDNRGFPKKLGSPWIRRRSLFSKILNGLLFGWTLWMYWPNLKSVAFPVPEIIGGTHKNWAGPGYTNTAFSTKFLIEHLFGWTLWMYWPNLKSVAFPVPEIIGGTQKIRAVSG